jgi:hypothetical protein
MSDGSTRVVAQEEFSDIVMIYECPTGTTTQIQPAMQIARVWQTQMSPTPLNPNRRYSSMYFPSPNAKPDPRFQFEDLGFREFQGVTAHGVRSTTIGTEADKEWNGKPMYTSEHWVSDDLCITLLLTRKDFKTGAESRLEIVNVNLAEPDPALFKIPDGYLINPTTEQMPRSFGAALPVKP